MDNAEMLGTVRQTVLLRTITSVPSDILRLEKNASGGGNCISREDFGSLVSLN